MKRNIAVYGFLILGLLSFLNHISKAGDAPPVIGTGGSFNHGVAGQVPYFNPLGDLTYDTTNSLSYSSLNKTLSVPFISVNSGAKCDGVTDDTAAIQSAVNSSVQKSIILPAGNCVVTSAITLTSNTKIIGAGYSLTSITASTNHNVFIGTDISGIEISGIRFIGGNQSSGSGDGMAVLFQVSAGTDQSNIKIHDNNFINFKGAGVVSIYGNNTSGVPTGYYKNVVIQDNIFSGNTDRDPTNQGIASSSIYLTGGVSHFIVSNNFCEATYQKVCVEMIFNVNTGTVFNNTTFNNGNGNAGSVNAYGILSYVSPTTDNYDISIIANHIFHTNNMGIYLLGVRNHIVSGNTFENADLNSTDISLPAGSIAADINNTANNTLTIIGNSIKDSSKDGIQVYNPVATNRVIIDGNNIIDTTTMVYGIRTTLSSFNVSITNNSISGTTAAGIYLGTNPFNDVVTGNNIKSCSSGIYTATLGTNMIISNNLVDSCSLHGIFSGGSTNVTYSSNTLTNNGGWGLFLNGTSTKVLVVVNSLDNNTSGNYFPNTPAGITQIANQGVPSTAVTYDGTGTQRTNQFINWGTTSLVNGSQTVTFSSTSIYTSSLSYAVTLSRQGTGGVVSTTSFTKNSGSSFTIYGNANESYDWQTIGN